MRVMVDTNILVSAILLDSKRINEFFELLFAKHSLVISNYIIDELFETARKKFPDRVSVIDGLLARMPYELVYTPREIEPNLFEVRDPDDYPILYTAVREGVEVLVTGDNDLLAVEIEAPEIMRPWDFIKQYA